MRERERALRKRKEREEQEVERVRLKARRKEAVESYHSLLVETIKDPQVLPVSFVSESFHLASFDTYYYIQLETTMLQMGIVWKLKRFVEFVA